MREHGIEKIAPGDDICYRLEGRYAMWPHLPNGSPEFGWKQFEATPINKEATMVIRSLRAAFASAREFFQDGWDAHEAHLAMHREE